MDEWTLKHMNKWLGMYFPNSADLLRAQMVWLFNTDPEYWGNQSYWKLHDMAIDACRER